MAYLANVLKFRRDITIFLAFFCHKFLIEKAGRKEGTMGGRKEGGGKAGKKRIYHKYVPIFFIF